MKPRKGIILPQFLTSSSLPVSNDLIHFPTFVYSRYGQLTFSVYLSGIFLLNSVSYWSTCLFTRWLAFLSKLLLSPLAAAGWISLTDSEVGSPVKQTCVPWVKWVALVVKLDNYRDKVSGPSAGTKKWNQSTVTKPEIWIWNQKKQNK